MSDYDDVMAAITKYLGNSISRGDHIVVRCPFHAGGHERTPSLAIVVNRGVWYCHACGVGGLLNSLLTKVSGIHFSFPAIYKEREAETGLDPGTLLLFDPLPKDKLTEFDRELINRLGILYDPWLDRIVYPIYSKHGKLVAVIGRLTDEEMKRKRLGKYKKYAMSEWKTDYVFHKGDHLWPLHIDFQRLLKYRTKIVLVEGFKAAMWLRMAGFTALAVMTASLSERQRQLLTVFASDVVVWFDWNFAGMRGMSRAADDLFWLMNSVRLVLPKEDEPLDGKQPDDFPLETVRNLVATAPLYECGRFYTQHKPKWKEK